MTFEIKDFSKRKGEFYYLNKLVIPKDKGNLLLHKIHCENVTTKHLGIGKTYNYLRDRYYWLFMQNDIENFIMSCLICKKAKRYRDITFWKSKITKTTEQFEQVNIDHFGSLALPTDKGFKLIDMQSSCKDKDFKLILTVTDSVSGFTKFIPVKSKSAVHTLDALISNWFTVFGIPSSIRSVNAHELLKFNKDFKMPDMQSSCKERKKTWREMIKLNIKKAINIDVSENLFETININNGVKRRLSGDKLRLVYSSAGEV